MARAPQPTVLVVDDDEGIRAVLRELLMDSGYHVRSARDGQEALALLRAATERMVALVDLVMPRMDGVALLNQIANDRALSVRHAYVLMSAQAGQLCAALNDLLLRLAVPVVIKPFDNDALLSTVDALARQVAWPVPV